MLHNVLMLQLCKNFCWAY